MKEYLVVVEHERNNHGLSPFGGLQATLNKFAAEGWELQSFDWSSWRRCIFVRDIPDEAVEEEVA